MILIPIMTVLFCTWYVRDQFRTGEPDSYEQWLSEPNDLEIVK